MAGWNTRAMRLIRLKRASIYVPQENLLCLNGETQLVLDGHTLCRFLSTCPMLESIGLSFDSGIEIPVRSFLGQPKKSRVAFHWPKF
jgi:hypothetical protein